MGFGGKSFPYCWFPGAGCRLEWKVPDPKDGKCTACSCLVADGRLKEVRVQLFACPVLRRTLTRHRRTPICRAVVSMFVCFCFRASVVCEKSDSEKQGAFGAPFCVFGCALVLVLVCFVSCVLFGVLWDFFACSKHYPKR
jgi:hypothetical protein